MSVQVIGLQDVGVSLYMTWQGNVLCHEDAIHSFPASRLLCFVTKYGLPLKLLLLNTYTIQDLDLFQTIIHSKYYVLLEALAYEQVRIQGGAPGARAPPLTLGFEAPKLSIFGPYLIFP